jgi:hypothetical protein
VVSPGAMCGYADTMRKVLAGLLLLVSSVVASCGSDGPRPVSCEAMCPVAVSTGCLHAPPTQADCISGCQAIRMAGCTGQYDAFARCAASLPSYTCDSLGQVTVEGCMTESAAIYTCLAGG